MLEYKGFIGQAEFDDEAQVFHGDVLNTRDIITFQARNESELTEAFRNSVDDYLAFCRGRGEASETPATYR